MISETLEGRIALEGKVALLLNEREIVINIGEEQGVQRDQRFGVYLPQPIEVHNPETDDVLGEIDDLLLQVTVSQVRPKFAICEVLGTRSIGSGPTWDLLNPLIDAMPRTTVPMTIRAVDSGKPAPIDEKDSFIKVGYRVKAMPNR